MSYYEISVRIKNLEQQLELLYPNIEPENSKDEMEELANDLMTQAEQALRDANFAKVKCCVKLAKIAST